MMKQKIKNEPWERSILFMIRDLKELQNKRLEIEARLGYLKKEEESYTHEKSMIDEEIQLTQIKIKNSKIT